MPEPVVRMMMCGNNRLRLRTPALGCDLIQKRTSMAGACSVVVRPVRVAACAARADWVFVREMRVRV